MAVNLSGLAPITTAAQTLGNLILVTPQHTQGYQPQSKNGQTAQQPPSLLFHYEGEQTATFESDITDHYIEDNTAIQDQIALKPEVITTQGYIGELNDIAPKALQLVKQLANKLTVLSAYTPGLSATALIAYNEAFLLYQTGASVLNSAISTWSSLPFVGGGGENVIGSTGLTGGVFDANSGTVRNTQNKQQVMFQQFYGYWRARTLFTVQTPWAVFQNMAIKSVRAIQDPDTRVISSFEVSFKMMRFASAKTLSALNASIFQDRASDQASGLVDRGTQTPSDSISLGTGLSSMGVA